MLFKLAWNSFLHRKKTLSLIIVSLAISLIMLLSLNLMKSEIKRSFYSSVSGTDLIVGARGGSLNLLLYSVFHIGDSMQPIDWRSFNKLRRDNTVAWAIPLTLGDSHKGYRVVATSDSFLKHYRYGESQSLTLDVGRGFNPASHYSKEIFEVVLGASVAKKLGYSLGDDIVVSHGLAAVSFNNHQKNPLRVVGIIKATGTPVDQALYVDTNVLALLHDNSEYSAGAVLPNPDKVSSVLLGLKTRLSTFSMQRNINEFKGEPLQAILPGVVLTELWSTLEFVEKILWIMAVLLVFSSLLAMVTVLLASMQERQRELAIVRVLGGGIFTVGALVLIEVFIVVLLSSAAALIATQVIIYASQPLWLQYLGFPLSGSVYNAASLLLISIFTAVALLAALMPAIFMSRRNLVINLAQRH